MRSQSPFPDLAPPCAPTRPACPAQFLATVQLLIRRSSKALRRSVHRALYQRPTVLGIRLSRQIAAAATPVKLEEASGQSSPAIWLPPRGLPSLRRATGMVF